MGTIIKKPKNNTVHKSPQTLDNEAATVTSEELSVSGVFGGVRHDTPLGTLELWGLMREYVVLFEVKLTPLLMETMGDGTIGLGLALGEVRVTGWEGKGTRVVPPGLVLVAVFVSI